MKPVSVQRSWFNVMESLVAEEVERQFHRFSPKQLGFISPDAVTTYALNRLKPLYANSAKGYELQEQRARQEFGSNIEMAVRQGIAAVERDPLRSSHPLQVERDPKAQQALRAMKLILQRSDLDWDNLPDILEQALNDASQGKCNWRPRASIQPGDRQRDYWTTGRLRSR
jgi:hypothetical protein